MKRLTCCIVLLAIVISLNGSALAESLRGGYSGIPTFSITTVVRDSTVTIRTNNFPANDTFTVRMGAYGTLGINGIVAGTQSSGSGGSFSATYNIPSSLAGSYQIALRLESSTSGYYAYNWFYNNASGSGSTPIPGYSGFPVFYIVSVVQGHTVTIQTQNLPPNDKFTVTMGAYGTYGIGGSVVATSDSGAGGSQKFTYDIPASLAGAYQIALRLQSPTTGYYAYNWFYNNSTAAPTPGPTPTPGPVYSGYPTFSITGVVRDDTVTLKIVNLPANDKYTVTMGPYGGYGNNGVVVGTLESGSGGTKTVTFDIPAGLAGASQIAIRLQSPTTGYYAYNWFYNTTYP